VEATSRSDTVTCTAPKQLDLRTVSARPDLLKLKINPKARLLRFARNCKCQSLVTRGGDLSLPGRLAVAISDLFVPRMRIEITRWQLLVPVAAGVPAGRVCCMNHGRCAWICHCEAVRPRQSQDLVQPCRKRDCFASLAMTFFGRLLLG
jgi:hypothetical protein